MKAKNKKKEAEKTKKTNVKAEKKKVKNPDKAPNFNLIKKKTQTYYEHIQKIKAEVGKVVVGQDVVLNELFHGLLAGAHVLVEGVPGTAKTLTIRALAAATGCKYSRVQFTVDLLPTDITGITAYEEKKGFYILKGPIFANLVIADEINRAPPKTQSALLEAMQEHQVTIGKKTFKLEEPFFVMATQNPIETEGTYVLPEAQLDRFLFKLLIGYPKPEEEEKILLKNISLKSFDDYNIRPVIGPSRILEMQRFVKEEIYLKPNIKKYIVDIIEATRKPEKYNIELGRYIELGASPRASIGLFIASKVEALLQNSFFVTPDHVKKVAHNVMRHRVLVNYEGQAEGITSDKVIDEILSKVKLP
ncbi:MoxR family ATPase [Candidatus Woesearchaeota archaeon]|nr:MoxR family ATPase [Candidatus Woesearchaeota archaeon]